MYNEYELAKEHGISETIFEYALITMIGFIVAIWVAILMQASGVVGIAMAIPLIASAAVMYYELEKCMSIVGEFAEEKEINYHRAEYLLRKLYREMQVKKIKQMRKEKN